MRVLVGTERPGDRLADADDHDDGDRHRDGHRGRGGS
jgi:hypothetical protein